MPHLKHSGAIGFPLAAYLYRVKVRVLNTLAYRFDFFVQLLTSAIMMAATVFLWRVAYRGIDSVASVNQQQMTTYAVMAILVGQMFQDGVQDAIPRQLRGGDIAIDLMRPISPLGCWLADDIGSATASSMMYWPPLLVLGMVLMRFPLPAGVGALLLFVPMCLLSFLINWFLGALVGLVTVWTWELGHFGYVKIIVVQLLGGALVPLWFFPVWFAKIVAFTPFPYVYQAPLAVYIGRTSVEQAVRILAIQSIWALLLAVAAMAVWSAARRRVQIQGG